jgi:outer membrane protein assembly factor BamB
MTKGLAAAAAVACLIVAPFGTAMASKVNWPQPGLNAQHTAFNQKETGLSVANVGQLRQKWSVPTSGEIVVPPIKLGETIYMLSNDGNLYALNSKSGAVAWTYPAYPQGLGGAPSGFGITSGNAMIYTSCQIDTDSGTGHAGVCALNAKTGAVVWTYAIFSDSVDVDSAPYNGPVFDQGKVFFGESDTASFAHVGYMLALDAASGAVVWMDGNCANPQGNNCDFIGTEPAAVDSGLVIYDTGVQNGNQSNICARSEASGAAVWCSDILFDVSEAPSVSGGKVLFAVRTSDGSSTLLTALNEQTGVIAWQRTVAGLTEPYLAPAIANGIAYFSAGGEDGHRDVYALSLKNGKKVWAYNGKGSPGRVISGLSVANGVVYGQCEHGACAFDAANGDVLLSAGGAGSEAAPIVADGTLISGCDTDNLCLYRPR